jgi:hypothetical protein
MNVLRRVLPKQARLEGHIELALFTMREGIKQVEELSEWG